MTSFLISGGKTLEGQLVVQGSKNAALPVIAAAVLHQGVTVIRGCPDILDVRYMLEILRSIGCQISWQEDRLQIDAARIEMENLSRECVGKMRSSILFLGALLGRCRHVVLDYPGGCTIGARPVDIHLDALKQMGVHIQEYDGAIHCKTDGLKGARIFLPYPSVGATENLMMAALAGESDTIIENCAVEPEIKDLQGFLRTCGFQVYGAGTDTIFVKGARGAALCERPQEVMYFILEDRIEAATYMAAVIGTGGRAVFRNIRAEYISEILKCFESMGAAVRAYENTIEVWACGRLKSPGMIITQPYPGFPTDFQPQILTLSTVAKGLTTIREEVFESRFTHKNDLLKMGADIEICGKNAIIKGVEALCGAEVYARDLRGGAALVLAGLMAEGRTVVNDTFHIHRGYEDFEKGIKDLGGLIEKKREKRKKEEKI